MSDSVHNQITGTHYGHSVMFGSAAGDVVIMFDRPRYRLEARSPVPRPDKPSHPSPSYLLEAQSAVVPFRARPDEERRLRAWRDQPGGLSVQLVQGPGGQGKTRLAAKFATESHEAGWAVAQAVEKSSPSGSGTGALAAGEQPLLVVVDYADRWIQDTLVELIESVRSDRTVRVLLLARPHRELWRTLHSKLHRIAGVPESLTVGAFAEDDRPKAFADAVLAFQEALSVAKVTIPFDDRLLGPDTSPLGLHMAALAATCAHRDHVPLPAQQDLSHFLLSHEWAYLDGKMRQVAFLATLFGPFDDAASARELLRLGREADGEAEAERILRAYHQIYPPGHREMLVPLRPDRFGEDFVAELLTHRNDVDQQNAEVLIDVVLDLHGRRDGKAWRPARRCMTVLNAAAQRHDSAESMLNQLFRRDPSIIGHTRFVPEQGRDAYREAMDNVLARHFDSQLPAEWSPAERADFYLQHVARGPEDQTERQWETISTSLTTEAVRIFRQLARDDPDQYLPDLALALNLQGIRLANDQSAIMMSTKHPAVEPAKEAVGIFQYLAKFDPERYLPEQDTALKNLVLYLIDAEDHVEAGAVASDRVKVLRRLPSADPGDLVWSLSIVGQARAESGDLSGACAAADEAARVLRDLAPPDAARNQPVLADVLTGLTLLQLQLGDAVAAHDAIQEAKAIMEELADTDPDAYEAGFGGVLTLFAGTAVHANGDLDDALDAARRAVEIFEERTDEASKMAWFGAGNALVAVLEARGDVAGAARVRAVLEPLED